MQVLTIAELKEFLSTIPDKDPSGNDYEVWIGSESSTSSECIDASKLNENSNGSDIILCTRKFYS